MHMKQLVSVAVFSLAGLAQAGGIPDLKSTAIGAVRESVHEKADSAMDTVGLQQKQQAAEAAAADGAAVKGEVAKDAAAEGEAVKESAKDAAPETPSAEDAVPEAPSAKEAAPEAPSVEDAAKGALKGLLD